jgi:hypothetical protein
MAIEFGLHNNYSSSWPLQWSFSLRIIIPVLSFILEDRISIPNSDLQAYSSFLLAAFAGSSALFSPFAGLVADKSSSQKVPFIVRLLMLMVVSLYHLNILIKLYSFTNRQRSFSSLAVVYLSWLLLDALKVRVRALFGQPGLHYVLILRGPNIWARF